MKRGDSLDMFPPAADLDNILPSLDMDIDRCSSKPLQESCRGRFREWLHRSKRLVISHPMVVITPLLVLAGLLAVGIVGVLILSNAIQQQRQDDALNEAVARGIVIAEKMQMASIPVHGLANFVLGTPNYWWPTIQQSFNATAQALIDLLAGSGVDTQMNVAVAPAGIVWAISPYQPNNSTMKRDLLADPTQRDSAMLAVRSGQLTLSGPAWLSQSLLGVSVRLPVFVDGSYGPNETFGVPLNTLPPYGNTPYQCPECYGSRRFWGFCSSILDWVAIRAATRVDELYNTSGYCFQLTRPPQGTETVPFVLAQSPDMRNQSFDSLDDETVQVQFPVLTSEWTLTLYRVGGWYPSWRAPMLAVVVIIAVIVALLIGLVMASNCRLMETTSRLEVTAGKLQDEKERMDALLIRQFDLISCFAKVNSPENSDSDLLGLRIDRLRNSLNTFHNHRVSSSIKPLDGDKIELHELLGSGNFGKVYRGTWRGTTVAVKCIVLPSSMSRSAHAERMALMETAISSSMHHPHLVQTYTYSIKPIKDSSLADNSDLVLLGPADSWTGTMLAATTSPRPDVAPSSPRWAGAPGYDCTKDVHSFEIQLVLEYCDAGSLEEVLRCGGFHNEHGLNFGGILDTAADVAKGMLHLHMNEILHSDLKAGNVMFRAGGHDGRGVIAKVVDFGLSIQLDVSGNQTHVSKMFQGTLTHMGPEVLLMGKQSKAADVYAFGILMFELYTATEPYRGIPPALLGHHVAREGRRPQFTGFTPIAYRALAESCWQANPDLRPTFSEILERLQSMRAAYPASRPISLPDTPPASSSPRLALLPRDTSPAGPGSRLASSAAQPAPSTSGRADGPFAPYSSCADSCMDDDDGAEPMIVLTDFRCRKASLGSCPLLPIPEDEQERESPMGSSSATGPCGGGGGARAAADCLVLSVGPCAAADERPLYS